MKIQPSTQIVDYLCFVMWLTMDSSLSAGVSLLGYGMKSALFE